MLAESVLGVRLSLKMTQKRWQQNNENSSPKPTSCGITLPVFPQTPTGTTIHPF